jgi:hypothetical protein
LYKVVAVMLDVGDLGVTAEPNACSITERNVTLSLTGDAGPRTGEGKEGRERDGREDFRALLPSEYGVFNYRVTHRIAPFTFARPSHDAVPTPAVRHPAQSAPSALLYRL